MDTQIHPTLYNGWKYLSILRWNLIHVGKKGPQAATMFSHMFKQDRRWNADKPSATLDPYIPIWLTTSPANQRPANFWKKKILSKHWKEIVKSVAFSGWTGEDQLQIWSSHSLILHIQIITSSLIIYQSIMEMLTYFHRMSLNKNCGCMIFSVAHWYRKSMSIIERVIYIYM